MFLLNSSKRNRPNRTVLTDTGRRGRVGVRRRCIIVASKFKTGRPRDGEADRRLDSSEGDDGVGAGVATLENDGGSVLAGDADGVEARWRG